MIDMDDFETDFDGALSALVAEAEREIAAIPEKDRDDYFTAEAANRLARVIEMKAPDCLVEMIESRSRRNSGGGRRLGDVRRRCRRGISPSPSADNPGERSIRFSRRV